MTDEECMARDNYGYGEWRASYWFLGPEQGMGDGQKVTKSKEEVDKKWEEEKKCRIEAWCELRKLGLNDCLEFHRKIGMESWHKEKPALQSTWRKLIRALLVFQELCVVSDNDMRHYQKEKWGRHFQDTCVIELSGLAARSLKEQMDRKSFRAHRIAHIRASIHERKPKFVVMYGKSSQPSWEEIAEGAIEISETVLPFAKFWPDSKFWKCGPTILAMVPHPGHHGPTNENWECLGRTLHKLVHGS